MNTADNDERIDVDPSINRILLFAGSIVTLVFSLLAALMPSLAYVTVQSNFFFPPFGSRVQFYPLAFSVHMFTLKLMLCAIGGVIGFLSLFEKKYKPSYLIFTAISIAALGLALPTIRETNLSLEIRYFDVPWIGFLLVLAGVSIMFLGLSLKNRSAPQITLWSVPMLLILYSIAPIMVWSNYLPRIVFYEPFSAVNILIGGLTLLGYVLMLYGTFRAVNFTGTTKPSSSLRIAPTSKHY